MGPSLEYPRLTFPRVASATKVFPLTDWSNLKIPNEWTNGKNNRYLRCSTVTEVMYVCIVFIIKFFDKKKMNIIFQCILLYQAKVRIPPFSVLRGNAIKCISAA